MTQREVILRPHLPAAPSRASWIVEAKLWSAVKARMIKAATMKAKRMVWRTKDILIDGWNTTAKVRVLLLHAN